MAAFTIFNIVLGVIKDIMAVLTYMAVIFVAFKALHALNIYIDKNSKD